MGEISMQDKQNIPILLLNLKRDQNRRLFMQEQLHALNVDYEIVEGIDGRQLSEKDLSSYSQWAAINSCGRKLSGGEIGCALSHAKIWEKVVKEGMEEALVLEDDVKLSPSILKVLENKSKFPSDYEFINFLTDAPQIPFGPFIFDIYRAAQHKGYANRSCVYLITRTGAEKLLSKAYPLRWATDGLMGRTEITGLISYGLYPQIAVLSDFESSIWENDRIHKRGLVIGVYCTLRNAFKVILSFLKRFIISPAISNCR